MQRLVDAHVEGLLLQSPEVWDYLRPLLGALDGRGEEQPSPLGPICLAHAEAISRTYLSAIPNQEVRARMKKAASITEILDEFSSTQVLLVLTCWLELVSVEDPLPSAFNLLAHQDLLETVSQRLGTSRIVTYNIHGDTAAVNEVLASLDADFVMLQEIYRHSLDWLAQRLGTPNLAFAGFNENYGIGFLSKWPILSTHVVSVAGNEHPRVLLVAKCLVASNGFAKLRHLTFGNTHLSPTDEKLRLRQITEMLASAEASSLALLGGDLNAVSSPDYTATELAALPPDRSTSPLVVSALRSQHGFEDSWPLVGGTEAEPDAEPTTSKFTAHDSMRIDYLFVAQRVLKEQPPGSLEPTIEPIQLRHLVDPSSDHLPVILDFVIK